MLVAGAAGGQQEALEAGNEACRTGQTVELHGRTNLVRTVAIVTHQRGATIDPA